MLVAYAESRQRVRQRIAVILRISARPRKGAHIYHEPHIGVFQQTNESVERPNRMPNCKERICHLCLASRASQHRSLVQGDVISRVAFNFVLRVVFAGVMSITFPIQIFAVHIHNLATDPASLRVPNDVITNLECSFHRSPILTELLAPLVRRVERLWNRPLSDFNTPMPVSCFISISTSLPARRAVMGELLVVSIVLLQQTILIIRLCRIYNSQYP